ncbi:DUF2628 domain-containing protein [Snodgrassella alvi]|uniref:DUF2628 domain-containing protein n=1 Tax=Snodgrassella alvi TaxID=1196083 RepID=UPI00345FC757
MDNNSKENFDFSNWGLSKAWQFRFEFYEKNGWPKFKNTAKFKENFKLLPFKQRIIVTGNFFACFGPLYFLCMGMWRKAIILWIFLFLMDEIIIVCGGSRGILICFNVILSMSIANTAYYLHRVKKSKSFNIFEGMF